MNTARQPLTVAAVAGAPALGAAGVRRVLLAIAAHAGRVEVALPTRPNCSTGWVRADDVRGPSHGS